MRTSSATYVVWAGTQLASVSLSFALAILLHAFSIKDAKSFLESFNLSFARSHALSVSHARVDTRGNQLFVGLQREVQLVHVRLEICHRVLDGGLRLDCLLLVEFLRCALSRDVSGGRALEFNKLFVGSLLCGFCFFDGTLEVGDDDLQYADDACPSVLIALVGSLGRLRCVLINWGCLKEDGRLGR